MLKKGEKTGKEIVVKKIGKKWKNSRAETNSTFSYLNGWHAKRTNI